MCGKATQGRLANFKARGEMDEGGGDYGQKMGEFDFSSKSRSPAWHGVCAIEWTTPDRTGLVDQGLSAHVHVVVFTEGLVVSMLKLTWRTARHGIELSGIQRNRWNRRN